MKYTAHILCALALLLAAACSLLPEHTPLTTEERRWIKEHPDGVRVGVSLHYPPYEIYDMNGHYQGLSADYIRLITEKTGLKFVPVRFRNREEALKALESHKVDMVAALEMTPELQEYLDFTQPYISVPAAIISRKEYADDLTLDKLADMRIGVTVSDHFTKYLNEHYSGTSRTILPVTGGYIGGLRALAVGDVDALICDMALASHYIANARISNLRIAGITNYSIDLRIASRKDEPMLGSIVRKGLALILPHERQVIEEEWLSLQYRPFWASRTFWMGVFAVFGLVFGSIVLVLFWNRSLKRQVNQRTLTLRSINTVLLGSLDCHTEQEVMLRCLMEARVMSGSEHATLAQLQPNGTLNHLLTVYPEDGEPDGKNTSGRDAIQLGEAQLSELRSGNVARAHLASEGLHMVIVPLQQKDAAVLRCITVMRRGKDYTPTEILGLTQVLFAFEEALQRKRAEISLHDKELQLQRVQRMEALGTLAGGIAHDFNNLLGVIIANGEMIELFHLDGDATLESKTKAILAAAYRGRDLVSQILSFTKLSNQEVQLVHVSHIIKETAKFLQTSLPAPISIHYSIGDPEPPVLADPTQLHQVLMNLCTNAAQAMETSGGVLTIGIETADEAPCAAKISERGFLCLTVSDTGCGMGKEVLERIFDPFFTTKTPGKGTGLGLAVVQGIVKAWGGCVQVSSEVGRGSVFRVYIPAAREQKSAQPAKTGPQKMPAGTGSILFVDDERELAETFRVFLESLGYTVHVETESNAALERFAQCPKAYDLVITDYSMPGLCGDKLARAILNIRPDVPIILCTGYSHTFGEEEAAAIGIAAFLNKPAELHSLAEAVKKLLHPDETNS